MTEFKFNGIPIVHTERNDVRDLVRHELKAYGASDVHAPGSTQECIDLLNKETGSIFVIDSAIGDAEVGKILQAAKRDEALLTREIFLILPEEGTKSIHLGLEYSVSCIHEGPITQNDVADHLKGIMKAHTSQSDVRDKLERVVELREAGQWSDATDYLRNMVAANPDEEYLVFELVENLIQQDDWQDALSHIHAFAESDEPNVRALHLSARCYMKQGDHDSAIGLMHRANILNPFNVDRLIDLGNSYIATHRLSDAVEVFGDAMGLEPHNKQANVGQAKSKLMIGEINEALPLLKSVSTPREMASIFNTSAILCARAGDYIHGLELYRTGVTVLRGEKTIAARLIFNMGIAYSRQDILDKAIRCFDKAFELDPSFKRAKSHKIHMEQLVEKAGVALPAQHEDSSSAFSDDIDENPFDQAELPTGDQAAAMAKDMDFSGDFEDEWSDAS